MVSKNKRVIVICGIVLFIAVVIGICICILTFGSASIKTIQDLWGEHSIIEVKIVCSDNNGKETILDDNSKQKFLDEFGSIKIKNIKVKEDIIGWSYGAHIYDEKGNDTFICLQKETFAVGTKYYSFDSTWSDIYNMFKKYA